jgi:hypothetical protein
MHLVNSFSTELTDNESFVQGNPKSVAINVESPRRVRGQAIVLGARHDCLLAFPWLGRRRGGGGGAGKGKGGGMKAGNRSCRGQLLVSEGRKEEGKSRLDYLKQRKILFP